MKRYFLLFSSILCFFTCIYRYHVFYIKNSKFSANYPVFFHFYRYLSGINFFLFSFLHFFLLILISYNFYLIFSFFWIYCFFWKSIFLYYCFLLMCVLPILLISFFTSLDLFYYNMFFISFFDKKKIFFKFFKAIHVLNFILTPIVFVVFCFWFFLFLVYNPSFVNHFNDNFFSNIAMFFIVLILFLRVFICFFDQFSMIFCKKKLFKITVKDTVVK